MNIPKALVTSLNGNEDMIDYMSSYRTQDKLHGKHYVPQGGLFWFECNEYGDFKGPCYFIKKVPDQELMNESFMGTGYRKLIHKKKEAPPLSNVLSRDRQGVEDILTVKKPRLKQ